MAVLALAGAAAIGTTALGFGWQAGWIVGSLAGNLLFGRRGPRIEGPRLSDLLVTSSAYGAPIPIAYGTLRLAGNVIWSGGIVETRESSGGGGKGGGGPTVVEYSYTASLAIAFAEGPARRVTRIWADGKLIHDRTGAKADVSIPGLVFRFHRGTETQLPDPAIEAAVGGGNVPAHRGLCYLVLEDLPLGPFGNRVPQITAEIAFRDLPDQPALDLDLITDGEGGAFAGFETGELAVDWPRERGWLVEEGSTVSASGLRGFDLRAMRETRQARIPDLLANFDPASVISNRLSALHAGPDGALYVAVGIQNRRPIVRLSGETLRETARFGSDGISVGNGSSAFFAPACFHVLPVYGLTGRTDYLIVGSASITATRNAPVGVLNAEGLAYVWGAGQLVFRGISGIVTAEIGVGFSRAWIVSARTSLDPEYGSVLLYELRIGDGGVVSLTFVDSVSASALSPGATSFGTATGCVARDEADGGVIFTTSTNAAGAPRFAVKWREADGVVWATPLTAVTLSRDPRFSASRVRGGVYAARFGATVLRLDTATGAILDETTWPGTVSEPQVFDALTETILHRASGTVRRIFLDRAAGAGDTAGQIVADLAARAGLGPADLDVAEIDDEVAGYVVARPVTARAAIEPLAQAHFFDAVESDDRLAFRRRGRAPVAEIPSDLLVPLEDGRRLRERRTQEVELPERVTVVYMDRNAGYRQGAHAAKRAAAPVAATGSREQLSVELPLALRPRQAKRIAEASLHAAWAERTAFEARLPADHLALEPTDVVTLARPAGGALRARIVGADLGADLTLAIRAVVEEAEAYVSEAEAGEGEGYSELPIPGAAATRLFVPNLPLLRDDDALPAGQSRAWFAAAGYSEGWPGATIFRGPDRIVWERIARVGGAPAWGALAAPLAIPLAPFATDVVNALDVAMVVGAPESVTTAQMLDGANAALVLRPDGAAELLQFRDAEERAPGRWRLTTLLRGRRGTEVFAGPHEAGAPFLLVSALRPAKLEAAAAGALRWWRAVGVGQGFDEGETLGRVHGAFDLKPYALVHLRAVRSGSDVLLSWTRRTRLLGQLRDGTGAVPLGEAAEAYEVDILAGPGGAVLRTLASGAPSVLYPEAAIFADFGAMPAALSVAVQQMSAEIGRGFPALATLEIL